MKKFISILFMAMILINACSASIEAMGKQNAGKGLSKTDIPNSLGSEQVIHLRSNLAFSPNGKLIGLLA